MLRASLTKLPKVCHCEKRQSSFSLLHVGSQCVSVPLDEEAVFAPMHALVTLSEIRRYSCVDLPLSYSLQLCVCFCANTVSIRVIVFICAGGWGGNQSVWGFLGNEN